MNVNLEQTLELLGEQIDISSRDDISRRNHITGKPLGVLIQDTYNNPFFPIRPSPIIDTSKLDLIEVQQRYRELYLKRQSYFLPWHFCIEMVNDRYFVFNTRPINLKFPINSNQAKKSLTDNWEVDTIAFMDMNIFDITDAIHVCIVGDSNKDIYTKQFYEIMGRTAIVPIVEYFKLPGLYQRIFTLNTGRKFNFDIISKFIRS